MRVLAITPTFFPIVGGAELLIRDVLNVWSEEHEVRLITPHLPETSAAYWVGESEIERTCRFDVVRFDDRVSFMRMRGHKVSRGLLPPMSLSAIPAIGKEMRRFDADMLVTFFAVPLGLPSVLLKLSRRVPLALVLCGNDLPGPRTRYVPLWKPYLRAATRVADRVVYVSRFCFDALERREFREPHDVVLHGGVDRRSLESTPEGAATVRRQLGLAPEDVMLFSLQRLAPEKRVDVLIRAFARIAPPSDRRLVLVVGGQGSESERLRVLAQSLGVSDRVVFTGHLGSEKADYFAASDVFVFHSIFETFGQVVAEAMSFGKPVASVRAGAIPEVVQDGVTGLLAEPNNEIDLGNVIARFVDDASLRRSMGEAGRERAKRMFDWAEISRQWSQLLALPGADGHRHSEGDGSLAADYIGHVRGTGRGRL